MDSSDSEYLCDCFESEEEVIDRMSSLDAAGGFWEHEVFSPESLTDGSWYDINEEKLRDETEKKINLIEQKKDRKRKKRSTKTQRRSREQRKKST